jgi:4'-phosphopantetheinyl transferase
MMEHVMTKLYFMEITPSGYDNVPDEMFAPLSIEKKERLRRYRHDIDRKIGVYSETLVKSVVSIMSGADYKALDIQISRTGKPYFTNLTGCEFNISHTKSAIAAAVSDKPVGVDIERVRDIDFKLAEKIFSENELAWLCASDENRNQRFFDIWTKKEALLKYRGTGLISNLKSADVTGVHPLEEFMTFESDGYVISVCAAAPTGKIEFISVSEQDFIEMWRKCQ